MNRASRRDIHIKEGRRESFVALRAHADARLF
jgi:hypothetical protein